MSRAAILGRIRAANESIPAHQSKPPGPPASLVSHGADAVARFCAIAREKGVIIVEAAGPQSLPASIADALATARITFSKVRLNDPAFATMPWSDAGFAIERGAAAPHDNLTLSRALAAVAETGTLVLASGPDNPTTLAFLSETHVVVVDRAAILGTFEQATALLRQLYVASLPRTINFISGASRTGDIGGRIVHGAHGPRHLIAAIV
jgi:L-lactate dehydrogenase complex protein LldG